MNNFEQLANPTKACDLRHVIEPLASYLCATEQPRIALKLALETLFSEIEQINRTADTQVAGFLETRYAVTI